MTLLLILVHMLFYSSPDLQGERNKMRLNSSTSLYLFCFILSLILVHHTMATPGAQATLLHRPSASERCGRSSEEDMSWSLDLLEDIYSNEVKHCMKATLKSGKQ